MENESRNEIKNLNENEVEKVAGGTLTDEELEKAKQKPSGVIDDINPIFREKTCSVCGRTVIVRYDRPPMKDCPDCICGVCEMEEWIKKIKAKRQ